MNSEPVFLIIDLFCGAGGFTEGAEQSGIVKVIIGVNHDEKAIDSHTANHPETIHFIEDIRIVKMKPLIDILKIEKRKYPNAKVILHASLECTNFSKAKGGQPREADSRTLADHLDRYVLALKPDYITIENVVEFMSWGPLDENGKPVSKKSGCDYMAWRNRIKTYGYYDQWRELNAANYGAYTSRNRLFGVFAKHDLPITFPEPTHSKKVSSGFFENLKKWKPVKDVLNFEDEGESIFSRKKPLSDKTLERIYAGLIKFIAKGDTSFISNYKSGHPSSKNSSLETVAGTLTTVPTQALIQTSFLLKYNSINGKTGVHHPPSVEEPAPVVSCQGRLGLVQTEFLTHFYGNGFNTSVDQPCPTLTTKERVALVDTHFINRDLKTSNTSINEPAGSIMTVPKMNLVEAVPFILNPSHGGHCTSAEAPCPVIVARQDKAPLYVVNAETGTVSIVITEADTEISIRIKQFMAAYGIADIKMRMLRVPELLKIQGFPSNYQLIGTQTDQKKFIGNSVEVNTAKALINALGSSFINTTISR